MLVAIEDKIRRADGMGTINDRGYLLISIKNKQHPEHRLVWEQHYGPIPNDMIIHHINGNKLDNRIENLMMVDRDTHNKIHAGYQTIDGITYKPCTKCGVLKPISEYHISHTNKTGIESQCKECVSEYNKKYHHEYYIKNKVEINIKLNKYVCENKDEINKRRKIKYHENKEHNKQRRKEYYQNNKEKIKGYREKYLSNKKARI